MEDAIRAGVNSTEFFAIAAGRNDERFIDLKYNQYVGVISSSDYLIKIVAALKQIADAKAAEPVSNPIAPGGTQTVPLGGDFVPGTTQGGDNVTPAPVQPQPEQAKNTRFFMSATLDNTRINRDVQRLVEEVISHLTSVDGAKVEVTLEVNVDASTGLPLPTVRTVSENCRTLKVKDFGFDE